MKFTKKARIEKLLKISIVTISKEESVNVKDSGNLVCNREFRR
jgi:hypothetical protein